MGLEQGINKMNDLMDSFVQDIQYALSFVIEIHPEVFENYEIFATWSKRPEYITIHISHKYFKTGVVLSWEKESLSTSTSADIVNSAIQYVLGLLQKDLTNELIDYYQSTGSNYGKTEEEFLRKHSEVVFRYKEQYEEAKEEINENP